MSELDLENTEFSPGVRRMQALCRPGNPLRSRPRAAAAPGRLGGDDQIRRAHGRDHRSRYWLSGSGRLIRQKALQLDLPVIAGAPIPILYVQMDGTGVPVVKRETVGLARQDRRSTIAYAVKPS